MALGLGQGIVAAIQGNHTEAVAQALASAMFTGGPEAAAFVAALESIAGAGVDCGVILPALKRE